jgi:hypothetical protein
LRKLNADERCPAYVYDRRTHATPFSSCCGNFSSNQLKFIRAV